MYTYSSCFLVCRRLAAPGQTMNLFTMSVGVRRRAEATGGGVRKEWTLLVVLTKGVRAVGT